MVSFDNLIDMKFIEGPWRILGVTKKSSEIQIKKAIAGYISEQLGLSSIDYTYKKYIKSQKLDFYKNDFNNLISDSIIKVRTYLKSFIESIRNLEKPDIPSLFTASVAFFRLENTFIAALLCLKQGLFAEAFMLERIILEQIAWIYQIYDYEGDFFKLKPSMSISTLKKIFPKIGILYGILSDFIHLDPKVNWSYVNYEENEGALITMYKSSDLLVSLKFILYLLDMYCIVGEIIYKDMISDFKHINAYDSSFKENRESLKLINDINKKLISYT